ncbi:hypothetical protein ER308_12075 [Egibacter rhizosphaerae]|uniref:Uncharacterized protein n=1 Tax=Egibacter rhizosphaerae TaxID=1670831 RepID=A0A411YG72_9ACTN|nr:hypothetical protein [Egibacter rhizosphaerae]QBI20230.1 hypothetical protein ER308_12075 [Egibacter rhizosphaerae]
MHWRVAYRRLAKLRQLGLVGHRHVLHGAPGVFFATRAGLRMTGVDLTAATVDLRTYRHSLALVSLAIDLEADAEALWTEREIRRADGSAQSRGELQYAVALADRSGASPRPHLHIPDLVLRHPDGELEAVELELTAKRTRRLRGILRAFVRSRHLQRGVTYYTPTPTVGRLVERVARELDATHLVRVVGWSPPASDGIGEVG